MRLGFLFVIKYFSIRGLIDVNRKDIGMLSASEYREAFAKYANAPEAFKLGDVTMGNFGLIRKRRKNFINISGSLNGIMFPAMTEQSLWDRNSTLRKLETEK